MIYSMRDAGHTFAKELCLCLHLFYEGSLAQTFLKEICLCLDFFLLGIFGTNLCEGAMSAYGFIL